MEFVNHPIGALPVQIYFIIKQKILPSSRHYQQEYLEEML
jgi:hypothetical protein